MKTINKVLSKCRFNPKTDTHLKLMIELDNEVFYLVRAEELLRQAHMFYNKKLNLLTIMNIIKAIQVLIIFLIKYEKNKGITNAVTSESTGGCDTDKTCASP